MAKGKYGEAARFNFEHPLTTLVWLTSGVSVAVTYVLSMLLIPGVGDGTLWWKLSTIITCGTVAGAVIPELVKVFTSTNSAHVREVVTASREGGASLNILSGLVAGNFSAYWMGFAIVALMAVAYGVSSAGLGEVMKAPAIFAFGLVAFGFLGMGPVTIAVDSYGPVTDNAQSVYELSNIERSRMWSGRSRMRSVSGRTSNGRRPTSRRTTVRATPSRPRPSRCSSGRPWWGRPRSSSPSSRCSKPSSGRPRAWRGSRSCDPLFLLGLVTGGAVIYWFSGASIQAVSTGAYRAVEFIKRNIRLDGTERASVEDSKKVVEICTQYAQKGMFNIFLAVFFSTLAFACVNHYFFIGYLISIAVFGLYQAIFMANAGGAWDNAKKLVETELGMKGTELHAATVVGDTVGDPFKDTSSVAMNPIIKFTTLFGLLAVELAIELPATTSRIAAAVFLIAAMVFVRQSFYGMRIGATRELPEGEGPAQGRVAAERA